MRDEADGAPIAIEIWRLPMAHVGSFLAGIPAPLGLGKVELADGRWVTGFICAAGALETIEERIDITTFGGWRAWLAQRAELAV